MDRKGHVQSILEFKGSLVELLIVAAAIGLSVNLVAGLIGALAGPLWTTILSAALMLVGCGVLIARLGPKVGNEIVVEGTILIDKNDFKLLAIDRYPLAEKMASYFRALFVENRAIERQWIKSKAAFMSDDFSKEASQTAASELSSNRRLIKEAIEYFILHKLSLCLSSHFNNNPFIDNRQIKPLERKDIPSILLDNRFLDQISRPMEIREPFENFSTVGQNGLTIQTESKIVSAYTADGAIFDHFELVLPLGSKVERKGNKLIISTRRLSLQFEIDFDGFGAVTPRGFEELYLGRRHTDIDAYQVELKVAAKLNWSTILSKSGWQYFEWIDEFLKELEQSISFDVFLREISWQQAYTAIILERNNEKISAG